MDRIPFSQQVAYLEKGALDADATEALAEVVMAVKATGKKGSMTVKLDLRFDEAANAMEILSKVTTDVPQPNRRKTILFPNNAGELVRDDPDQQPLFGRNRDTAEPNDKEIAANGRE